MDSILEQDEGWFALSKAIKHRGRDFLRVATRKDDIQFMREAMQNSRPCFGDRLMPMSEAEMRLAQVQFDARAQYKQHARFFHPFGSATGLAGGLF